MKEETKIPNVDFSKFPLTGENFQNKKEVGQKVIDTRAELRSMEVSSPAAATKNPHIRVIHWGSIASIAATAVIIACVASYFLSNVNISSTSKNIAVLLPDNSKVDLFPSSQISYNKLAWLFARNIDLAGKARFNVEKGSKFTVSTIVGNVSVLGTQFLVNQKNDNMRVDCFEGRVNVNAGGSCILNTGEYVECTPDKMGKVQKIERQLPEFVTYNDEPLINVINEIEKDYKISIAGKEACGSITFTGLYPTRDLNTALQVVLGSCGLRFTRIDSTHIVIQQ